ncbi:MAG: hypothetical protein WDZ96_04940 [Acidimicrobiia bacterium]
MTKEPLSDRVERIRDRLAEIDTELATIEVVEDTATDEPAEQGELLSRVTQLRDEHRVLLERLELLAEEAEG